MSGVFGAVPFLPVDYFEDSFEEEEVGKMCNHVENLHNRTIGWEFTVVLHVGFNGFVYLGKVCHVGFIYS